MVSLPSAAQSALDKRGRLVEKNYMDMQLELQRYGQIVKTLGIVSYYHLFKLMGNLVDGEEGVIEHRVSQLVARSLLRNLDFEVQVSGTDNVRGLRHYCVVSTHASHLDWAVLLGYFPSPLRFIARKDLTAVPVIGSYLKLRGILIDRSKGDDAKKAIRRAAQDDSPFPILLFPEGTRSPDGEIKKFKRGGLRIMQEEGLQMVPVRINGTFDAFPRDARLITTGGRLQMLVGQPLDPREHDDPLAEIERRVHRLGVL